ncbi:MAG: hypothetical protein AB9891_15270 [Anaerolineaceae bacterium]
MTDENSNLLTPNQKRSLFSSLFFFEKALRNADQLLFEEDLIGIFYSRKSHIDFERRNRIHVIIQRTLDELKNIFIDLKLNSSEDYAGKIIMAEMSISWEYLEESRSRNLRKYGHLNPRAIEVIDPIIDKLSQVVLEINSLVT